VAPGAAAKSWGIQVARLAGVPKPVLARAGAVLAELESRAAGPALAGELPLFSATQGAPAASPAAAHPALLALLALDADSLAPRDALAELYRLKGLAEGTEGM
jgi:DNA mismatch repair protein MutS